MKKRKLKKSVVITGIIIIVIITTILLVSIFKKPKNPFLGTWISESGTIYTFKKNHKGVMKTSLSEHPFAYRIKSNILSIDYNEEKVIDTDYKYSCNDNKCIVTSDKGTFTFNKKQSIKN